MAYRRPRSRRRSYGRRRRSNFKRRRGYPPKIGQRF